MMLEKPGPGPAATAGTNPQTPQSLAEQAKRDAAAGMSANTSKNPLIYLGRAAPPAESYGYGPGSTHPGPYAEGYQPTMTTGLFGNSVDKTATLSEVTNQYYGWDSATKNRFITQLNLAGFNASGMSDSQLASAWADYAGQAARYYQQGSGQKLTPWDILAKDMQQREAAQPRTVTSTSSSSNMSTSEDAHAIFMQAAQSLLGRDPTKTEISSFRKKLNEYESANPTVTTTTSNYVGQDLKSQSSKTTGGVSADTRNMMAMENAKSQPEFGAYQAATTYMDALMKTISGG
ncbi:MAG TPA: hypothetical protein VIY48_21005 [Candidatus Paceibacterota bacterium]